MWAHTEITYQSTNETLEEALSSILSPLSLEWSNFHGVLVIAADKDLVSSTRVYLVKQARFVKDFDLRNIVKFIFENVAKTSWEKGDGHLAPVRPDFLVIYQTPSAHREIEKLQDVALPPAIARKTGFDARNPLSKEISVSFADTPLNEAIQEIAEKSNVRISLDTKQLAASSLSEQQYITLSLQNVRAESVLTLVLLPLDLYDFKNKSVIQVRSKSYAYQHPITVAHDISGIHGDGYNAADRIKGLLEDFIETDTWSKGGGNGTISLIPPSQLSITNAEHVQIAIQQLLQELRQRGLIDETLIVVGGEFGRTPFREGRTEGGNTLGRDHYPDCNSMILAGGGIRGGISYGETDELGFSIVKDKVHVHDLQATILHQLGFDHTRLTYRFQGRDYRLTDVHGEVVKGILS